MSRCGCVSPSCSCVLGNTDDFVWTGSGSNEDPFELAFAQGRSPVYTCTSATRPAHADGRRIFETDTGLRYFSLSNQWYLEGQQVIYHGVLGSAASTLTTGTLIVVENGWELEIQIKGRITTGGGIGVSGTNIQFNGDSGSNYAWQILQSVDATAAAVESGGAVTSIALGDIGSESANRFQFQRVLVQDYRGSHHKDVQGSSYYPGTLSSQQIRLTYGVYMSTNPITSITINTSTSTFIAGSAIRVLARSTRG